MAVVKANAYGHGAPKVALALQSEGCRNFAVSNVEEAMELLTKEDFERSRRAVYARSVQDWNSTTEIAENFMDFAFSGTDMLSYPQVIENVRFEDLEERIRLSYHSKRLALSIVKPAKEK